ncbi:amidohydrolase family protein [Corallococcus sp. AS-1-6]|uniref:amidohydrolase family protein n=1 Tax=Corallococcus sp. AS-1-6 TaxID=2874599 RepID=UPI001CC1B02C|nr:amidohydrolase family protein [Corallococcus sp. AS-1-6]MBZ4371499.1 amidohydrolase family protein [Corallococcus sp. AS-1-6]
MSLHQRLTALALVCLASSPALAERIPVPSTPCADKVSINGLVFTASKDPAKRYAQALAEKDGKVIAVGSNLRALSFACDSTQVVNLAGATVTPGFVDPHEHERTPAALEQQLCPIYSAPGQLNINPTYSEALDAVTFCATYYYPAGAPMVLLLGPSFNAASHGQNVRAALTMAAPLNPVIGFDAGEGHGMVANDAAFAAVCTPTTPDAQDVYGGYLGRLDDGSPDGFVQELQQVPFFRYLSSFKALADKRDEYRVWRNKALAQGIVYALDIPFDGTPEETISIGDGLVHPVEQDIACLPLSGTATCPAPSTPGRVRWVKVFLDGAVSACGGNSDYPYLDPTLCPSAGPGWSGRADISRQQLEARMRSVMANPEQCLMVHAFGREATRVVAEVATALWLETGRVPCLTVEHADMTDEVTRQLIAALGIYIVQNAPHLDLLPLMTTRYDSRELNDSQRFRSLLEAGIPLALGGDTFGAPEAPLKQIHRLVTQARPEERLTVEQAVTAFTRGSAEARRLSNLGTLEPGKDASYVVLSHNIFSGNLADLEAATVTKTVIRGELGVPVPPPAQ